jgi:hypothetical protein
MCISGASHSTVVVDLDGVGVATHPLVTEIEAEQAGCVITHVVIVLGLCFPLVIRVRREVLAVAVGWMRMITFNRPTRCEPST